jgi:hypothetical protein
MRPMVSFEAYAAILDISARSLERRVREPNGPRITRVGRRRMFAPDDAEDYAARCRQA